MWALAKRWILVSGTLWRDILITRGTFLIWAILQCVTRRSSSSFPPLVEAGRPHPCPRLAIGKTMEGGISRSQCDLWAWEFLYLAFLPVVSELGLVKYYLNIFLIFQYKQWCMAMDQGKIPSEIKALLTGEEQSKSQQNLNRHMKAGKTDANSNSCEYTTWTVYIHVEECLKVGFLLTTFLSVTFFSSVYLSINKMVMLFVVY